MLSLIRYYKRRASPELKFLVTLLTVLLSVIGSCIVLFNFASGKSGIVLMKSRISTFNKLPAAPKLEIGRKHHHSFQPKSEFTKEEISSGDLNVEQDDPRLLNYILRNNIVPPSKTGVVDWNPVHYVNKTEQLEVSRYMLNFLGNKTNGIFIECGANDGEFFSNTALLEQSYGWTGLLVESDPRPLKRLLKRNRRAYIATSCLSTGPSPKRLEFLRHDRDEGLSFIPGKRHFIGNEEDYYSFEAQCFPLFSILSAIDMKTVDYFSLDIEGAELDVLKTVPWKKVLIRTLSIEVHPEYVKPVRDYMTSVGYVQVAYIKNGYSHDEIFAHESILQEYKSPQKKK